ncbi:hypothetical protein GOV10_05895 [Candidatus Woesearchaeota archaeon]|nr:hypothetical protein [Candidatus Woesearchaeota archaeon]
MKATKILGIGALAAAMFFSTSGYSADTYIKNRNKKLTQLEEAADYELLIHAPWCGTCQLLKKNIEVLGDEPTGQIQIQKGRDLYDLRNELRKQDIDIPGGVPIMIDKVDGEVTVYYGFGKEKDNAVMYKWDGFKRSPTDRKVGLEKILE